MFAELYYGRVVVRHKEPNPDSSTSLILWPGDTVRIDPRKEGKRVLVITMNEAGDLTVEAED
ncbi:MAG: hypothetical protein KGJ23_07785 [Euryarchaeota archaeon]|nr:hypothetical protein [Euryarchaeota archaeon]MDE1836500.1 hypothetical protein [Euryarchaeota archaeon]MDE1879305.1 hypothetical protein [Euryarchaeota archaeon]MDE2044470.1 hypothetical protein [Thermoplasmata archaeon]